MIEPITQLVLNLTSNPNAYCLLLGSGISSSAGIPTGYQVNEDLINKLAFLSKEKPVPTPFEWYAKKFGKNPNYSEILESVSPTKAERKALLNKYFEPTDDEKTRGLKTPTPAHLAIARLVKSGFFKRIITTNFDRLLEKALDLEGITPTVISNEHAAKGAPPSHSNDCIIFKVNGDYLETTMKNTLEELKNYEKPVEELLDKMFDEYGLVVCGWSGEWDHALRNILQRCKNHRYTSFWTYRDKLKTETSDLIKLRKATAVEIVSADTFFVELESKINSYSEFSFSHPASREIAVSTVKKFIERSSEIKLRDFVMKESEKLCNSVNESGYSQVFEAGKSQIDELKKRIIAFEKNSEVLLGMIAYGCFWGDEQYASIWKDVIELVAYQKTPMGPFNETLMRLNYYPALILLYGGAISTIANNKFATLSYLLKETKIHYYLNEELDVTQILYPGLILESSWANGLPKMDRMYFPGSEWVYGYLKNQLKDIFKIEGKFDLAFDKLEYFLGLISLELPGRKLFVPYGPFIYRQYGNKPEHIENIIDEEINRKGINWEPFRQGLFDNSTFAQTRKTFETRIGPKRSQIRF